MKPCALYFAVEPLSDDEKVRCVVPIVNGVPFTRIVEEFESERGYHPAGGYAGIVPDHFNFGPLDKYFLGAENHSYFSGGRVYLLGCQCGEVGCWPLEATLRMTKNEMVWDEFSQPFRPDRDYLSLGPLVFRLEDYLLAVNTLYSQFGQ